MSTLKKPAIIFAVIILFSILIIFAACSKKEHHRLSQFTGAETCGGCHDDIYKQWRNSTHALAHKDQIYRKVSAYLLNGLTDPEELKEAELCVKCHIPVGYFTGFPQKVSDDQEKAAEITKAGVQCDFCHSAAGAEKIYNNNMKLIPGTGPDDPGIKRGPLKDSKSDFHGSEYSGFHTKSEFCGVCHNVKHVSFGTPLESTYDEWVKGPYNSKDPAKRIECQGCHMYQRPGVPATGSTSRPDNPGKTSSDGPDRKHVFTHYFIGGNSYIPSDSGDKEKSVMAEERLKNAAEIKIKGYDKKSGELIVSVKNTGAGHYLPTGLTDVREMWLEIEVKDSSGKIIFSSGRMDKDSYLPPDTVIYNTRFGDGKGNEVGNITKAREILKDKRIPPLESMDEKFKIVPIAGKEITVSAALKYRIAPQKVLDLVMGKGIVKVPVVIMAEVTEKIRF